MPRTRPLLSIALLAAGCAAGPPPRPVPAPAPAPAASTSIRVGTTAAGERRIRSVPLEAYVLATVLSEMAPPADRPETASALFSVQAIVARTYAVANRGRHAREGFDLCDSTHCQIVDLERPRRSRWSQVARAAVEDTAGVLVWHAGRPASVLFHADCGGARASASDVWGGVAPAYLHGGDDPLPAGFSHATWTLVADREELRAALNARPNTAVGGRLDTIEIQHRDPSGRASLLVLNGERAPLVRGEEFRAAVSARLGARALRSARFEVRREGERFVFEGQGFGHGVGLCQRGAVARAAAGQSPGQILAFYFPGTGLAAADPSRRGYN